MGDDEVAVDDVTVDSPSGETYTVRVDEDGNAYCGCEWGEYRPRIDSRTACSHSQAALDAVEKIVAGRSLSAWKTQEDADRQHRPSRDIGDGVVVTSRAADKNAAWASAAARTRKMLRRSEWQESQTAAASMPEEVEEAIDWKRRLAARETAQDQAAEEAKMALETADLADAPDFRSRLAARA